MKRVLLAAHPTVGHTQALRAVGRELRARGHQVRFALPAMKPLPSFLPVPAPLRSSELVTEGVRADGFDVVPLPVRLSSGVAAFMIARSRGYDELDWAMKLFTGDAGATANVLKDELRRAPADVVLADCFHFGSWIAAEAAGVPFVPLFHSGLPFPAPGAPPFGSPLAGGDDAESHRRLSLIAQRMDAALGTIRATFGLAPERPRMLERPYGKALNVLTTFEPFELPRPDLEKTAAGPLLWAGPCLGVTSSERTEPTAARCATATDPSKAYGRGGLPRNALPQPGGEWPRRSPGSRPLVLRRGGRRCSGDRCGTAAVGGAVSGREATRSSTCRWARCSTTSQISTGCCSTACTRQAPGRWSPRD